MEMTKADIRFANYQKLVKMAEKKREAIKKEEKRLELFPIRSERIRNPKKLREKELELRRLEAIQDDGEPVDWATQKKIERLRKQIYEPTIRQQVYGFKPGVLRKEESDHIILLEVGARMKKTIEEFVLKHPPWAIKENANG